MMICVVKVRSVECLVAVAVAVDVAPARLEFRWNVMPVLDRTSVGRVSCFILECRMCNFLDFWRFA